LTCSKPASRTATSRSRWGDPTGPRTFVVIGAGLCGATAVATLRERGFDGRVVLVGEEPFPPYERPPLSKELLRGEQTLEQAYVRPPEWYEQNDVEARFGTRVDRLDVAASEVVPAGGERVPYDACLIATGVRNRRLDVPGADLANVFDVRFAPDAERLRTAAARASKAVLVGAGFIGCEVAASLRTMGLDVTIVEPFETALYRVLGPELGRTVEAMHRDHGVEMLFRDAPERLEGSATVEAVVTREGRKLGCDLVVIGVGTQPATEAAPEGADTANGIAVDPTLATGVPNVWAAGDVANHDHPVFGRIRVEHFDNAIKMGETAARNMLGAAEVFDDPHWFWSDQYDSNIQMAGFAASWDTTVIRGSLEERRFAAFLLKDGVLRSALTFDLPRDARRSMPLIRAGARPDPTALADPDVDLRKLVGEVPAP
jgi:3-phenylpropionate/trans-cinnamate dioxygenase ferredoxin reductase subunit